MPSPDLQEMLACQPKKYAHGQNSPALHFFVEFSINIRSSLLTPHSSLIADFSPREPFRFVPEADIFAKGDELLGQAVQSKKQ